MEKLRVMSIMAHQDDFEFEAAGLFAMLRKHYGNDVELKVLTTSRGASGHHIYDTDATALMRDGEARASAALVGAEYENLKQLDGSHINMQVFCDRNMLGGLWNAIRAFAPHYIIAPPVAVNPLAGIHIDHQHTAEAVRLVAYQLGVPNAYPTMNAPRVTRFKPPVVLVNIDGYAQDVIWHFRVCVDEVKEKVQLSLLPPADLERREAMIQQNRNRRQNRGRKPDNARRTEQKVQKKEPVTMEDATARLLERFGKKH